MQLVQGGPLQRRPCFYMAEPPSQICLSPTPAPHQICSEGTQQDIRHGMVASSTILLTFAMAPLPHSMAAAACSSVWLTSPWRAENSAQSMCTKSWWVAPLEMLPVHVRAAARHRRGGPDPPQRQPTSATCGCRLVRAGMPKIAIVNYNCQRCTAKLACRKQFASWSPSCPTMKT